jgi:hypothetical protein
MIAVFGKIECPREVRVAILELYFLGDNFRTSFDAPCLR